MNVIDTTCGPITNSYVMTNTDSNIQLKYFSILPIIYKQIMFVKSRCQTIHIWTRLQYHLFTIKLTLKNTIKTPYNITLNNASSFNPKGDEVCKVTIHVSIKEFQYHLHAVEPTPFRSPKSVDSDWIIHIFSPYGALMFTDPLFRLSICFSHMDIE